jgi:superfamily I DNA/RNA helicase
VSTYAAWINSLYDSHERDRPNVGGNDLLADRAVLAKGALGLAHLGKFPLYDTLFIDEAQDLLVDEISLLREWSEVLFFVGDARQHIFGGANGLNVVAAMVPSPQKHILTFHYRLAPELCEVADKILKSQSGVSLASTEHYNGPKPGVVLPHKPAARDDQLKAAISQIKLQLRAYGDLIAEGDRLGIVVARRTDRDQVLSAFESDAILAGLSQIVRAREADEQGGYSPTLDPRRPILILTVDGCKGLEFRAVHWLFCDENTYYFQAEHYYTVVTRAKTRIDLYCRNSLPPTLAAAYAAPVKPW